MIVASYLWSDPDLELLAFATVPWSALAFQRAVSPRSVQG